MWKARIGYAFLKTLITLEIGRTIRYIYMISLKIDFSLIIKKFLGQSIILDLIDIINAIICQNQLNRLRRNGNISASAIFLGNNIKISHPESITIGECTVLHDHTYLFTKGGLTIGHHVHLARGITIFTCNHNFKSNEFIPYGKDDIMKPVKIEDCVWIGANVSIIPGVTIEEGSIVGMGTVVSRNIPKGAIVGGNPAKIIGNRDMKTYERLKKEGKFY